MQRLSKSAALDMLIATIAHYTLAHHKDDEIFINKATTQQIVRVKKALDGLIDEFALPHQKQLSVLMEAVSNRVNSKKGIYDVTDIGLSFALLYLGFAPNERKGKAIFSPLAKFWQKYQRTLLSVSSKADNGKYERYAEHSFKVASIYIDTINEMR